VFFLFDHLLTGLSNGIPWANRYFLHASLRFFSAYSGWFDLNRDWTTAAFDGICSVIGFLSGAH
jgi:hypothetical protein